MKKTEKQKQGGVDAIEPVIPQCSGNESASGFLEEEIRCLLGIPEPDRLMETIGNPTAKIVHGLNNALTTITGYAEMSMFVTDEESPVHYYQKQILGAALRAGSLASQLTATGRGGLEDEAVHCPGVPGDTTGNSDTGAGEGR